MRIAVIQMMYPKGHQRLDEEFVRVLAREHQLIVVDNGKYFPANLYDEPNIEHIKVFQPYSKKWEPLKRTFRRLSLLFVLIKLRHRAYDRLLFLNCHNALYKVVNWLPQKKCVIIHHNDVDILFTNKKYVRQFNKVKEKFHHVFLADYISESFVNEAKIDWKYVYTIHQPLVFGDEPDCVKKENLLVGIGNSTDDLFIKEAISLDIKYDKEFLANKLILRSKNRVYKGTNLEVISGFLPRSEYEMFYRRAKVSVLYYPSSYVYRYSGIMDDSLAKGLVVYCNDTLCGRYFASTYPQSVRIFKNAIDLWKLMGEPLPIQPNEEKKKFHERHSAFFILAQFNSALK